MSTPVNLLVRALILLVGFTLVDVAHGAPFGPFEKFATLLYGQENFEVMMKATDVQACLLTEYKGKRRGEYKEEKKIPLSPEQIAELRKILNDSKSYVNEAVSLCLPQYGVRFIFFSSGKHVNIDLCFLCDIIKVSGPKGWKEATFYPSRKPLLNFSKSIFPHDNGLRKLH
ncbi:MAG: hypothetical protein ABI615_10765 [Chthoniobacterales bacterium]